MLMLKSIAISAGLTVASLSKTGIQTARLFTTMVVNQFPSQQ
jgi:hypothetical protein